jgi:ribosomal protein L11 methyltransferase
MRYYELTCQVSHEASEAVAELLHRHGANGVAIEDASLSLGSDSERFGELYDLDTLDLPDSGVTIKAYFAETDYSPAMPDQIRQEIEQLQEFGLHPGNISVSVQLLSENDWSESWKQYYHPIRVTDRLMIIPSWELEHTEIPAGVDPIVLDPGMAFGTGTHPTTLLCLRALEDVIHGGETVMDVGCGSAILSIAAAKLGASDVLALDLDSVAVRVARENVAMNGVDSVIRVEQANLLQGITGKANVIVANILAEIVVRLTPDAYQHLLPGGVYITSGIIASQADHVYEVLRATGFQQIEKRVEGDWVAFVART